MTLIRVLFDTNVLIYAHNSASIYHFEAADLLAKVFDLSIQGIVAEQVLIEMYRTLTNRSAMKNNPLKPFHRSPSQSLGIRVINPGIMMEFSIYLEV